MNCGNREKPILRDLRKRGEGHFKVGGRYKYENLVKMLMMSFLRNYSLGGREPAGLFDGEEAFFESSR